MEVEKDKSPTKGERSKGKIRDPWSEKETEIFFSALLTCGRNFDQITAVVKSKNREQVRHFYYRIVKKVTALLGTEIIDKKNKEQMLTAVICFGSVYQADKSKGSEKLTFDGNDSNAIATAFRNMVTSALKGGVVLPNLINEKTEKIELQDNTMPPTLSHFSKNPEKLALQLVPLTKGNSDLLKQKGHNPKLLLQLKSLKTISFVVNHITNKMLSESIQTQIAANPIRLFPNNQRTHGGWGIEDTNVSVLDMYLYLLVSYVTIDLTPLIFHIVGSPDVFQLWYGWEDGALFDGTLSNATLSPEKFTPTLAEILHVGTIEENHTETAAPSSNELFISSFYVNVHQSSTNSDAPMGLSLTNGSASMGAFANDASSDGFGRYGDEEKACKNFYSFFENSNEPHEQATKSTTKFPQGPHLLCDISNSPHFNRSRSNLSNMSEVILKMAKEPGLDFLDEMAVDPYVLLQPETEVKTDSIPTQFIEDNGSDIPQSPTTGKRKRSPPISQPINTVSMPMLHVGTSPKPQKKKSATFKTPNQQRLLLPKQGFVP